MFAFYCPRCGMTSGNAVAIPSSGYQTVRNIIGAGGTGSISALTRTAKR